MVEILNSSLFIVRVTFYEVAFPLILALTQTDFRLKICGTTRKHIQDISNFESASFSG